MPRGDGTGPMGKGKMQGGSGRRGQGRGGGRGGGVGGGGGGPVGFCVCPKCGARAAHQRGMPCSGQQCPKCGNAMTRE